MNSRLKQNPLGKLGQKWGRIRTRMVELGFWNELLYEYHHIGPWFHRSTFRLTPRHARHALYARHGTSDQYVFEQIFIELEYAPLCGISDVQLVMDCGANVGYSSAYFLTQFPECHVIAVEPDQSNFAMLERNLLPYGNRVTTVRSGIWSESVPLVVSKEQYRDGKEWTFHVRPCQPGEKADFQGVDIESLLATSGFDRISLLKIDIEGAEVVLFRGNVDWLDRVDALAIELHEDSAFGKASDVFHSAMHGRGFEFTRSGELTICRRTGETARCT
jgi:FkbM family methyltransferase